MLLLLYVPLGGYVVTMIFPANKSMNVYIYISEKKEVKRKFSIILIIKNREFQTQIKKDHNKEKKIEKPYPRW